MPVVVIGLSHHTSAVELREKFAFRELDIPAALAAARERGLASEGVILSTCNRVELYAVVPGRGPAAARDLLDFLRAIRECPEAPESSFYTFAEPQSIEHLFKVACGLDSMVLGETEILGQLKKAYQLALQHRHTAGRLNKTFQRAFNVAKHIRHSTNIQRGSVSVGSVAVELAQKIFSRLNDHQVMVLGAGDTSEKTARALLSRGAKSIIVSNRSFERAALLASEFGGRAVRFEDWSREFGQIDIVISSTSAPHYMIDRAKIEPLMKLRRNRPLLLIDIAVPRDIDPDVNFIPSVYLYNIDDLQAIAADSLKQRQEEISRCEEYIREKARGLLEAAQARPLPAAPGLAYES